MRVDGPMAQYTIVEHSVIIGFHITGAAPFLNRKRRKYKKTKPTNLSSYRLVWGAIIALKGRLRSDGGGWMLRVVYGGYGNTKQQEAMAGCQGHILGAFWHLQYLKACTKMAQATAQHDHFIRKYSNHSYNPKQETRTHDRVD